VLNRPASNRISAPVRSLGSRPVTRGLCVNEFSGCNILGSLFVLIVDWLHSCIVHLVFLSLYVFYFCLAFIVLEKLENRKFSCESSVQFYQTPCYVHEVV